MCWEVLCDSSEWLHGIRVSSSDDRTMFGRGNRGRVQYSISQVRTYIWETCSGNNDIDDRSQSTKVIPFHGIMCFE